MDAFLTIAPLVITAVGLLYFAQKKIKKFGLIYVIAYYTKWFIGIAVTMFAFYVIMISGDYLKEHGFSVVFSLPVGIVVWFIPMHYVSKYFTQIEERYKKEEVE